MGTRLLDNTKKTYNERSKHIEEAIKNNKLNKLINSNVQEHKTLDNSRLGERLDNIANYLLESQDIESGRKVDYGFYRSEKDYRSNFAMGRNSIAIENDDLDYFENNHFNNSQLNKEFILRLFDPAKLSEGDIRRFIVKGCNYTQVDLKELKGALNWLHEEIISNCTEREKEIVEMFDGKTKATEIADKLGVNKAYISKTLKNISKKCKKWLTFTD